MTGARRAGVLLCVLALGACAFGETVEGGRTERRAPARPGAAVPVVPAAPASPWDEAGSAALRSGLMVPHTLTERLYFPADEPFAAAYGFQLRRGQAVRLSVEDVDGSGALQADMFEVVTPGMYRPVRTVEERAGEITYAAAWTGEHVLRLRPPPGGSGEYVIRIEGEAPLRFPVDDGNATINSVFGDPRDGGVRDHTGVDIFADRGTPVVAAGNGTVTAVQNTPVGGLVIWMTDSERGLTYYYAHLDTQLAVRGQTVRAGDVIGTVGNSGNASGTRPHLHFAVYLPGTIPIDPAPMLVASQPAGQPMPTDRLEAPPAGGRWMRVSGDRVRLRAAPSVGGVILREMAAGTAVRVVGSTGDWLRVLLRDGTTGFMASGYTAPLPAATAR